MVERERERERKENEKESEREKRRKDETGRKDAKICGNRRFLSLLVKYHVSSEAKGLTGMRTFHSLAGLGLSD